MSTNEKSRCPMAMINDLFTWASHIPPTVEKHHGTSIKQGYPKYWLVNWIQQIHKEINASLSKPSIH